MLEAINLTALQLIAIIYVSLYLFKVTLIVRETRAMAAAAYALGSRTLPELVMWGVLLSCCMVLHAVLLPLSLYKERSRYFVLKSPEYIARCAYRGVLRARERNKKL